MDVQVQFSRWLDEQQGYADKWYPVMERPLQAGCWLLDRQGNLGRPLLPARHEEDRLEPYLLSRQSGPLSAVHDVRVDAGTPQHAPDVEPGLSAATPARSKRPSWRRCWPTCRITTTRTSAT